MFALAVSIVLNTESKPQTSIVAQTEPEKQSVVQKSEPKNESPKKAEKPAQIAKTVQTPATTSVTSQPKKQPPAVQSQSVKSQKTETVAKNTQVAKTPQTQQSSSNVKVVTKEMKEASNAAKTIPQNKTSQAGAQIASAKTPAQNETIQQQVPRKRFDIPPASNGATIVIIIDDAGRSAENTKRYAALPFPITIAVLPKLPQSRACADVIRRAGKEVILHQPMQSMNLQLDPGPGKITENMSGYEIAAIIKENLAELGPGVKGMNNHEGSLITANVIKIGTVLDVCAEMGVYFLDSRTTAATKAPQAALERDMHIFEKAGPYLDNDIDRAKMLERMRETLAYANRHGRAIVIGHVDKSVKILPDLLAEMYPEMKAAGYRFATPSMLK